MVRKYTPSALPKFDLPEDLTYEDREWIRRMLTAGEINYDPHKDNFNRLESELVEKRVEEGSWLTGGTYSNRPVGVDYYDRSYLPEALHPYLRSLYFQPHRLAR